MHRSKMSKKILLSTIHAANSYGGVLQCYATYVFLKKTHDVDILDYATPHLRNTLNLVRLDMSIRAPLRIAKDLLRLFPRYRLLNKFKSFMSANYSCTNRIDSYDQVSEIVDRYDCLICGSDQIWNPKVTGHLDLVYFLAFKTSAKKIALSSSMGSYRMSEKEMAIIRPWLSDFNAIGLRESDTLAYLQSFIPAGNFYNTCDPTLLLTKEEWTALTEPKCLNLKKPYILVYSLKESELLAKTIVAAKEVNPGVAIIALDQHPLKKYQSNIHINDASPQEFLTLFANASAVLTNSFHGVAFSLNFDKPFLVVAPESGANRILGLLEETQALNRYVVPANDLNLSLSLLLKKPDARDQLNRLRKDTINFINSNINC